MDQPQQISNATSDYNQALLQALLQAAANVAHQQSTPITQPMTPPSTEETIATLETRLKALHGEFSWHLHNDLRHYYMLVDARQSRYHADVILQHQVMDGYTLDALTDWHFTNGQTQQGIARLNHLLELYAHLPHLCAACLIRLGDAYLAEGMVSSATKAYQRVLEFEGASLAAYRALAEKYLGA